MAIVITKGKFVEIKKEEEKPVIERRVFNYTQHIPERRQQAHLA